MFKPTNIKKLVKTELHELEHPKPVKPDPYASHDALLELIKDTKKDLADVEVQEGDNKEEAKKDPVRRPAKPREPLKPKSEAVKKKPLVPALDLPKIEERAELEDEKSQKRKSGSPRKTPNRPKEGGLKKKENKDNEKKKTVRFDVDVE